MATIVDVARRAGVSVSTVSHVVNGTRHVNPETQKSVEAAIAEIGYMANSLARALKRASTDSVGIAISAMTNPYFSDIICAIETECARLGLMVFLCDTQDDPVQELKVVQALRQRRVDGIILASSGERDGPAIAYLRDQKIPFVLVDRLFALPCDQVGVDNKGAMQGLVAHLIEHGHSRIGYVRGQPGFSTGMERLAGYRAALKSAGLAFDAALVTPPSSRTEAAAAATAALLRLERPPTAIAAGNNMALIGAMHALREKGLSVPGDMALAGFDDFEWADYFEPRLTVVAQPCEAIGREAAALLVERIRDMHGQPRTIRLKTKLILRTSCGCEAAASGK